MGRKDEESLPAVMDTIRKLRSNLEKVCADALRNFEEATGLTVEEIELIRNMNVGMNMDARQSATDRTRIAIVKITMRL